TQIGPYFQILEDKIQSLPQKENGRLFSGMIGFLSYPLSSLLHPKLRLKRTDEPLAGFVLPSAILCFDHWKNKIYLNSILPEKEEQQVAREIRNCLRSV